MSSFYKDVWNEKYSELALELFDKEYWECSPEQIKVLDSKIQEVMRDWMADRIDAAGDRAKYEGLQP
jgi:hypothetical protein